MSAPVYALNLFDIVNRDAYLPTRAARPPRSPPTAGAWWRSASTAKASPATSHRGRR